MLLGNIHRLLFIFIIILICCIGLVLFWIKSPSQQNQETVVVIDKGDTFEIVIDKLLTQKLIKHPFLFKIYGKLQGVEKHLHTGAYVFPPFISAGVIVQKLREGKTRLNKITVPEGLTVCQIYDLLKRVPFLNDDILSLPAEGTLFPNTYYIKQDTKISVVFKAMQKAMQDVYMHTVQVLEKRHPYVLSPKEIITLASIIEKESGDLQDMRRVSGVFHNRLQKNMPLQADPTVIYAVTKGGCLPFKQALNRNHITQDHPFNTYMRKGLPPHAICNPGANALYAALNPEVHDYIYFVARGKDSIKHSFARTLQEHNQNVKIWRRWR